MKKAVYGFDWDAGNQEKCLKHGLTLEEIESVFDGIVMVLPDPNHSDGEDRLEPSGERCQGDTSFSFTRFAGETVKHSFAHIGSLYAPQGD